jgi:hypothetical protein
LRRKWFQRRPRGETHLFKRKRDIVEDQHIHQNTKTEDICRERIAVIGRKQRKKKKERGRKRKKKKEKER